MTRPSKHSRTALAWTLLLASACTQDRSARDADPPISTSESALADPAESNTGRLLGLAALPGLPAGSFGSARTQARDRDGAAALFAETTRTASAGVESTSFELFVEGGHAYRLNAVFNLLESIEPTTPLAPVACGPAGGCPARQVCAGGFCRDAVYDELTSRSIETATVEPSSDVQADLDQPVAKLRLAFRQLDPSSGDCAPLGEANAVTGGSLFADNPGEPDSLEATYRQASSWGRRRLTTKTVPVACGTPLRLSLAYRQCDDPFSDEVTRQEVRDLGALACPGPDGLASVSTFLLSESIAGRTCRWNDAAPPDFTGSWAPPPCVAALENRSFCAGYNTVPEHGCAEGFFDFIGVRPSDPEYGRLSPEVRDLELGASRSSGLQIHAIDGPDTNRRHAQVDVLGNPANREPLPEPARAPAPADHYGAEHRFALINVVPSPGALRDYALYVPSFRVEGRPRGRPLDPPSVMMELQPPQPERAEILPEQLANLGGALAFKPSYLRGQIELVGSRLLGRVLDGRDFGQLRSLTHVEASAPGSGFAALGLDGSFDDSPAWRDQRWTSSYVLPLAGPNATPDPTLSEGADPGDPRWSLHQPSTWEVSKLFVKARGDASADSTSHLNASMLIQNLDAAPITLADRWAEYAAPEHRYCMGELQVPFISRNGRAFSRPEILHDEALGVRSEGSYSRDPADPTDRVPPGFVDRYRVTQIQAVGKNVEVRDGAGLPTGAVDATRGRVNLVLPQGEYTLSPRVTYAGGGAPSATGLPSIGAIVRCGEVCSTCDDGTSLCVNNDFAVGDCTADPAARLSGSSASAPEREIRSICYRVSGGARVCLCDDDPGTAAPPCSADDSGRVPIDFSLDAAALPLCVNEIAIEVESVPANPADGEERTSCPWSGDVRRRVEIEVPETVDGCFTSEEAARDSIRAAVSGGCGLDVSVGAPAIGELCSARFPVTATDRLCGHQAQKTVGAKVDTEAPFAAGELAGCFADESAARAAAQALVGDDCSPPVIAVSDSFDPPSSCGSVLTMIARDSCGAGNEATLRWSARIDGEGPTATAGEIADCAARDLDEATRAALEATSCADQPGGCGVKEKVVVSASGAEDGCSAEIAVACADNCGNQGAPVTYDLLLAGPAPSAEAGALELCYTDEAGARAAAEAATRVSGGCGAVRREAKSEGDCSAVVTVTAVDACGSRSEPVTYLTRIDAVAPLLERGEGVEGMCYASEADAEAAALAATRITDNCPDVAGRYVSAVGPADFDGDASVQCVGPVVVLGEDACGNAAPPVEYAVKVDGTPPVLSDVVIGPRTDGHQVCFPILGQLATDDCAAPEVELVSCTGGKLLNDRQCERRNSRSCVISGDQVCFDLAADTHHAYEFTLTLRASDAGCAGSAVQRDVTVHIDSDRGECPAQR